MSVWILESGTARLLDLLSQLPGLAVTLNPQTVRDRQRVGGRLVAATTLVALGKPEQSRDWGTLWAKGLSIELAATRHYHCQNVEG